MKSIIVNNSILTNVNIYNINNGDNDGDNDKP